jgi:type VI secretion system secreted protein Hcp
MAGRLAHLEEPMPIYVSFSSIGGNSLGSGHSRVHGMKRGFTVLTPANLRYALISPRDAASGLASGKRQHKPITITKEVDSATPLLFNTLCNNENIYRLLNIHFAQTNPQGAEEPYFSIKLTNAMVTGVERIRPGRKGKDTNELEEIEFTFAKIEITWAGGGKTARDDWTG